MQEQPLYSRILGGLTNALIGDAMGAATEMMTPDEITRHFGGKVTTYYAPPPGTFAYGNQAGQLTDDSSQMLRMVDALIESNGPLKIDMVVKHLLLWASDPQMLERFAGPSTRRALAALKEGKSPLETGRPNRTQNDLRVSNGSAMKVSPAGLANPGNVDAAIADAITMSTPTHMTNIAFAGAAAIAAAIAEAMTEHASLLSIADAAIYGAEVGDRTARDGGHVVPGASVAARLRLAVKLSEVVEDFDQTCAKIGAVIGCGLPIVETVPAAIGVFLAARGNPIDTVIGCVNMGDDSDTVATIAGALAGAHVGFEALDSELVRAINAANPDVDLPGKARALTQLALAKA